jgi:hypothetical protein
LQSFAAAFHGSRLEWLFTALSSNQRRSNHPQTELIMADLDIFPLSDVTFHSTLEQPKTLGIIGSDGSVTWEADASPEAIIKWGGEHAIGLLALWYATNGANHGS